ncbi:hypothetical protein [Zooshikella harenae]|uniref:DUF1349 domain-containing protein n=1 Tax=Zooshikella harenae TaxID=2827238 RepID=A0ABS5ZID0_9GAMM|nr:hypothetical protein [Zooshikella harenae]MBU2713826.1 hypothetical protein [Zooshikella harenae]
MIIVQSIEYEWDKSQRGSKFAVERSLLPEELPIDVKVADEFITFDNRGKFLSRSKNLIFCDKFIIKAHSEAQNVDVEILGKQFTYGRPATIKINSQEWVRLKYNYRRVEAQSDYSNWYFGVRIINIGIYDELHPGLFLHNKIKKIYDFQSNLYRITKV